MSRYKRLPANLKLKQPRTLTLTARHRSAGQSQVRPANQGGGSDLQGERNALIDWSLHAAAPPRSMPRR